MKTNALYIHGFMGNPKGGTFETLTKALSNWNIHSIPFPDLHTDISKTQQIIKSYCKENNIEMLIGASLGAFYVLQYEDIIDKLVINPCMYPSIEIPKQKDRKIDYQRFNMLHLIRKDTSKNFTSKTDLSTADLFVKNSV